MTALPPSSHTGCTSLITSVNSPMLSAKTPSTCSATSRASQPAQARHRSLSPCLCTYLNDCGLACREDDGSSSSRGAHSAKLRIVVGRDDGCQRKVIRVFLPGEVVHDDCDVELCVAGREVDGDGLSISYRANTHIQAHE